MARQPFVWEAQVRREILEEEIAQIRDLPYSLWRDMVGAPMARTTTARDGRAYRITLAADWARRNSTDIRVTLTLRPTRWSFIRALRNGFVISADGILRA
jgi:hypothetical protein